MTRPAALPPGHACFEALALGRRVAAELAVEVLDPAAPLAMADRFALATLSLAIEAEAARRAGAASEALPLLAAALARIERGAAPIPIPAAAAAGSPRSSTISTWPCCGQRSLPSGGTRPSAWTG